MTEAERKTGFWTFRKPSIASLIASVMTLGLVFSGFLLPNPADSDRVSGAVSAPASAVQAETSAAAEQFTSAEIDSLIAQLQDTQARLQGVSTLLEQKSQPPAARDGSQNQASRPSSDELPAIWAEVDQLYQVMQPLMVQLEIASASQSSRPVSELIALRTRINTIHQRLAFLLSRVEAAGGDWDYTSGSGMMQEPSHTGPPAGLPPNEAATIEQFYRNMAEFQKLLDQMQRQGFAP